MSIGSVVFGGMRYGDQIRIYKAKVMLGFSGSGLLRSAQAQLGTALFGKEIELENKEGLGGVLSASLRSALVV